jgi:CRP/FNR family transcriptional regulator, cyclic AMP receptor protein
LPIAILVPIRIRAENPQFFASWESPYDSAKRENALEMSENFLGLFESETEVVTLAPGEALFEKGEPGRLMYVVKSGDLQILDGNHVYEIVSAGGIVGEMAMVDGSPRSATVRAIKPSIVIPIDERRFLFLVQQTPFFALRLMRLMTARLRAMNDWAKTVSTPE